MCASMVDIQSATAEIRRGKNQERRRKKKKQDKNIMSASATQGGHNKQHTALLSALYVLVTALIECGVCVPSNYTGFYIKCNLLRKIKKSATNLPAAPI